MAGGEPFLIKENLKILDLIQRENPELLLRINTNLSILNQKIFDQLKTLKNVHWIVSAESTEERFNYIRWPGNYATLIQNLKKIKLLPHKITINMTWNILCAFNILDFIDDMQENGLHPNQFVMNYVTNPIFQNISNISENQRQNLINNIKKRKNNINSKFYLYKVYDEMINLLKEPLINHRQELYNNLIELDKQRNLNSKDIFPELYEEILK